jgi:hypothetical protein
MKKQIRRGVFETNSSSIHSLTMCTKSDYDRWKTEGLYLYLDYGYEYPDYNKPIRHHFYTRQEAIAFVKLSEYAPNEGFDWNDDEQVEEFLYKRNFYHYEHYWNRLCRYFESFSQTMTTSNGEDIIAFGHYGFDG